jgi:tRNA G46 methylase TrmB
MITENISDSENLHYSEDRDDRVKDTAEVFTPDWLVQDILNSLDIDWENPPQDKIFCDPTCGSGNFLIALANRGIPLKNLYGVDLMQDNICTTKKRLTEIFLKNGMSQKDIDFHLNRNIVCEDALTYHYEFWWYDEAEYEARKIQQAKDDKIQQVLEKNKKMTENLDNLSDFDDF